MLFLARSPPPRHHPSVSLPKFKSFKSRRAADQLHARLLTTGLLLLRSSAVLRRLLSSPHPPLHLLARRLFLSPLPIPLPSDDPFLYNALIKSSSHGPSDPSFAIIAFALMLSAAVPPDRFSFSLALKACSKAALFSEGSQLHSLLVKCSVLNSDTFLQNCLIGFYSKCGRCHLARQVFDRMEERDFISWNSLIDGYVKSGRMDLVEEVFGGMEDGERNLVTWNTIVGGYAGLEEGGIDVAREVFDQMPERDLVSWNLMVDGYAKWGRLDDAVELFERMPERDVISWANMIYGYLEVGRVEVARRLFDEMPVRDVIAWNIMMAGYVKNGRVSDALLLFNDMRREGNVAPDTATLAIVLSAIAELGRVHDGIAIHEYIKRNHLSLNGKLGVGLIDMYSKCGHLADALRVFEVSERSVDHWNAMIGGLAIHGHGELALLLFQKMNNLSLKPDEITFIAVLNACSHAGLVVEGLMFFEIMKRDYKLVPKVQHYGCMVDILARAGKFDEAWKLIERMPIEPNDVVWRSLLSACRNYGNLDMGLQVAEVLMEGGICNASSHVLLSNIYAGTGMWGDVNKIRVTMKEKDLRKIPGCSWIELDGVVHEFVMGDNSHPQAKQVYSLLEELYIFGFYGSRVSYGIQ